MPTETDSQVALLQQAGLSPDFISRHFGLVVETHLSPQDTELADKVREFVSLCLDEARWTILYGAPQDRAGLLKVGVAKATGMLGQEGSASINAFYNDWNDIMAEVRDISGRPIADDDVIDVLSDDT